MRASTRSWTVIGALGALFLLNVQCGPQATNPLAPTQAGKTGGVQAFGVSTSASFPTWQVGGATGDFRVHPQQGPAPLTVHINMCHSTDPTPSISLHYHVEWGDGSDDHGFCRFEHVYENAGTFQANACVWDEIPAHWPGVCLKTTFTALGTPSPTPTPLFCHPIVASSNIPSCFIGGGLCPTAACPTGATQFCDTVPIVATSSGQARAACAACLGATACTSGNLVLGSFSSNGNTNFVYFTTPGPGSPCPGHFPAAGEIDDFFGCPLTPSSRWAP